MVNSNRKGKNGERELRDELSRLFGVACRRGQQYCGASGDADVIGLPGVHVECKRVESLHLWPAVDQAVSDAGAAGNVPMICHRPSNRPWVAIVRLDDLPNLCRALAPLVATQGAST